MKNNEIFIETLELCGNLIQSCAKSLREMGKAIEKCDKDYLQLYNAWEEQANENQMLKTKIGNILKGVYSEN